MQNELIQLLDKKNFKAELTSAWEGTQSVRLDCTSIQDDFAVLISITLYWEAPVCFECTHITLASEQYLNNFLSKHENMKNLCNPNYNMLLLFHTTETLYVFWCQRIDIILQHELLPADPSESLIESKNELNRWYNAKNYPVLAPLLEQHLKNPE